MTDKINLDVISEHQRKALDTFYKLKSIAAVEVRIKEEFFFVPWKIWKNGQEIFGRKYLKAEDIKEYRVPIGGDGVLFLEGILQRERAKK
jgi:recombination protein U